MSKSTAQFFNINTQSCLDTEVNHGYPIYKYYFHITISNVLLYMPQRGITNLSAFVTCCGKSDFKILMLLMFF